MNYQYNSNWVLSVDVLSIIATSVISGVGYHQFALATLGNLADFVAIGLVTAIIFCGVTRLTESTRHRKTSSAFERAHDCVVAWLLTILLFVFATFFLKVGEDISRAAALTFFVFAMGTVIPSRTSTPVLLARAEIPVRLHVKIQSWRELEATQRFTLR